MITGIFDPILSGETRFALTWIDTLGLPCVDLHPSNWYGSRN